MDSRGPSELHVVDGDPDTPVEGQFYVGGVKRPHASITVGTLLVICGR